jgi:hypothetical protein
MLFVNCSSDDDAAIVEPLTRQQILLQNSPYVYNTNSVTFIDSNPQNETNSTMESIVENQFEDVKFTFQENNEVLFSVGPETILVSYNINSENTLILFANDDQIEFKNFNVNLENISFLYVYENEYLNGDNFIFQSEVIFN